MYRDKDRQESLIAASDLDWTIVRPAPFSDRSEAKTLQVHLDITNKTHLTKIARDEVADFVVATLKNDLYLRQRPFIGHP